MKKLSLFISNYFWMFFIIGMIIGIFIKSASILSPYITWFLMLVLFLSFLNINFKDMYKKMYDIKLIIYLVLIILIITPVVFYFIFNYFLDWEYVLAILILVSMPAGMAVPVYSDLFHGDRELALVLVILTSFLCPLTIPLLIYFLFNIQTNINYLQIFSTLAIIIFIPFIASIIFKKIIKKKVITKEAGSAISIILITLIITGAVSKINFLNVLNQDKGIVWPFFALFIVAILLHIIGYFATYKSNQATKITSSLALAYMNSALAIGFTAQFFGSKTLLLVILYQIPTNLILIAFGVFIKKYIIKSN